MMHGGPEGEQRQNKERQIEARIKSVNSMLPPSLALVALCLHGAHILSGKVLSSLVWPDLFTLQARLQLSNTYQNIYSPPAHLCATSMNLHHTHYHYPSTSVLPSPSPLLTVYSDPQPCV